MNNDIFKLKIHSNLPIIEQTIDALISDKEIILTDNNEIRRLGIHIKPLKQHGIIGFYRSELLGETIVKLKTDAIDKKILPGRNIEYNFKIPNKTPKYPYYCIY